MNTSKRRERGASAVELAIVAPFLLILLLGIVEFGFVFGQYNELRHAVREGARYAAVSEPDLVAPVGVGNEDVVATVCNALGLGAPVVEITTTQAGTAIGDVGSITVTLDTGSLSNAPIISIFVPDQLENTATFRLEQVATWSAFTEGDISVGDSAC